MLNPEEQAHYRDVLLARRDALDEQEAQTEDMAQPVSPDPAIGRLTRQDAMQQQQLTLETRRRLQLQRTQN